MIPNFQLLLWACGVAILIASPALRAQDARAPQNPAPPPAAAPAGLETLSDDRLIAELQQRGLANLLEHAYAVNNVPQHQRQAMAALAALQQLADPNSKMSTRQRQQLVTGIVGGIDGVLPAINDPKALIDGAEKLLEFGVEPEVNTLEYWGESARSQVPLRPVVEAVLKMLDKAAAVAQKEADAIANTIAGPDDPNAARWEAAANLASRATYTRHMAAYYLALSMDAKASAQRKEIAARAAEYLLQFDNAESTLQPIVRGRIGKLHMVRGEFPQAKETFATIADGGEIEPRPTAAQQWEARYFGALCDLLAGDVTAAQKSHDELVAWQKANMSQEPATRDAVAAATAMLQYRIHSHVGEANPDAAARKAANDRAVAILMDLVKRRPELRSVIYRQLLSKLPEDADLKSLDVLLLQAFVQRADEERLRPENERADAKVLRRGIDAAREVLRRRRNDQIVDLQIADSDALLIGFFLERLGDPASRAAAAEAFLDYIRDFGKNASNAQLALDNALVIVGRLRANPATANEPATVKAYERVLPVAIRPPFSRIEFAYEYGRRLLIDGKPKEALDLFRMVPQTDPRYTSARFFEMAALQQRLDQEKLADAERKQVIAQLQQMVDDVAARVRAGLDAAKSDAERTQYRSMLVRTLLLAADVARREQNDPARTLNLLEGFESLAAGLPNERDLIGNVLYTRVQAHMQLGNSDAATQTLVALLKAKPGGEGAAIVYKLLQKLNEELDAARLQGRRERMQTLARNRAQLSGFLVDWARNNADPNIKKFTYRYSVFDAATKHLAADLEPDPAARKAGLESALALYKNLESPESAALYQATLPADAPPAEKTSPDPAVSLGIGLIAYDLGDFAEAQRRLGQLLTDRKLGTPTVAAAPGPADDGQTKIVHNDQYWEATLKLMRSNVALAIANASDAQAQSARTETENYLKQLYVRWGRDIGGAKWSGEFEKLRAAIIPSFNPDDVIVSDAPGSTTTPATMTPTTTQPAVSQPAPSSL